MTAMTTHTDLVSESLPYLQYLEEWLQGLAPVSCDPQHSAVLVVDMLEGFCEHGPLASPRVNQIVEPVAALLEAYGHFGGAHVVLTEDAHPAEARQFASFPPHCLAGSAEARTVARLRMVETPAWRHFTKETINGLAEPALHAAIDDALRTGVLDFVVVGDCTDLCVYQLAMALQVLLNRSAYESYRQVRVVVPADAVATYDLPVADAPAGVQPHPAGLLHVVFLHHMALNGVVVAREVVWQTQPTPSRGR
jgi:nicotinamidase-related amidase